MPGTVDFISPLVDDGIDERVGGRQNGLLRDLAAIKLDANLRFLARAHVLIQRTLGQGLLRLQQVNGFRALGYERQRDYVTERLGISVRLAQELLQMERDLPRFPQLQRAFAGGRLSRSKVRLLLRREDAEAWVERATSLTVRALEDALRSEHDDEDREAGQWLNFELTVDVMRKWTAAVEVARRLVSEDISTTECLQLFVAELLAGPGPRGEAEEDAPREDPHNAYRNLQQVLEEETGGWRFLSWHIPEVEIVPDLGIPEGASPAQIDERLREALRLGQRVDGFLMRILRTLNNLHLTTDMQFSSIDHYVRERLGVASRTARTLTKLDRDLDPYRATAEAFYSGHITQTQAQFLVQVMEPCTEAAWLSYAKQVATLQLKRDVERAAVLRETDPDFENVLPPPLDGPWPVCAHCGWTIAPGTTCCAPDTTPHTPLPAPVALPADAPLPSGTVAAHLRVWLPDEFRPFWNLGIAACRALQPDATLEACLELLLDAFLAEWGHAVVDAAKQHPLIERDGWHCSVPVCSCRRTLEEHHIVYRSHGGSNKPPNLITSCYGHHHHGVHEGRIEIRGEAPAGLRITLGIRRGTLPHMVFEGRRRIYPLPALALLPQQAMPSC
ncbi:MAG: 13E12 repeat family protein [Candidatus Xenobia bacterium]